MISISVQRECEAAVISRFSKISGRRVATTAVLDCWRPRPASGRTEANPRTRKLWCWRRSAWRIRVAHYKSRSSQRE